MMPTLDLQARREPRADLAYYLAVASVVLALLVVGLGLGIAVAAVGGIKLLCGVILILAIGVRSMLYLLSR
jgi:hypothetical protein